MARTAAALLMALLIMIPLFAFGQTGNNTITGTVEDPTGAPIPGVLLTISNLDTGVEFQTATNESGLYRQGALAPGNYQIIVEAPGFNRLSRGPIILQVSQTLANRAGDFSDLRNTSGRLVPIYDPATPSGRNRFQFPNNIVPEDRIDPVARAVLNYYPLPNRQGTATNASNYVGNSTNTLHRNIIVGRVDHQFRANDLVTGRYYINDSATYASGTCGIPVSDPFADITDVRVQSILGAYTHNLLNHANFNVPGFTYGAGDFGVVTSARPGRTVQLAGRISF